MQPALPAHEIERIYQFSLQCLLDLTTEEGINASSKDEAYGCIFGRDSALTILKILKSNSPSLPLLLTSKRALLTLAHLQGKEVNIETGEQPGKFIHEYRKEKFDHLLSGEKPWFVYPSGVLKNFDSLDATPLGLITFYRYYQQTQDNEFLITVLPVVEAGLNWIISFGDLDKDYLLEYDFPVDRRFGGLVVQSWTDSKESIVDPEGRLPSYPIAPVEVQAYAWLALRLWAKFYQFQHPRFAQKLLSQASLLKKQFNKQFIFSDNNLNFAAQALDGSKNKIKTITANPLLCLWATDSEEGKSECIVEKALMGDFVQRAFQPDLFSPKAGIRTMSSTSPTFNSKEDSYHNGSFWPILNAMIAGGLENFGYQKEATTLRRASLNPLIHFGTPIELHHETEDGQFIEYRSSAGQQGCRYQAWSAAAALEMCTSLMELGTKSEKLGKNFLAV